MPCSFPGLRLQLFLCFCLIGNTQFIFEHSFDDGNTFQERGKLCINTSSIRENFLSQLNKDQLLELANKDGFYLLRINTYPDSLTHVMTLTPARFLFCSNFHDVLTVHLSPKGSVIAMDLSPTNKTCRLEVNYGFKGNVTVVFKSKVLLAKSVIKGTMPVVNKKIRQEVDEQLLRYQMQNSNNGSKKSSPLVPTENEGFFQKYWIYFIPGLLFYLMLKSIPEQPTEAGGSPQ
ncbi:ER membrane protein complex subunit 10-like [Zophobas morio]|uniref:ER membrane protein complex subunit 10-like n=1 Tax=Zophobas morio TaxID=2755281 RepID=UPI0030831A46